MSNRATAIAFCGFGVFLQAAYYLAAALLANAQDPTPRYYWAIRSFDVPILLSWVLFGLALLYLLRSELEARRRARP